jgi:hypothetical protein
MQEQRIDLQHDSDLLYLKKQGHWKWFFVFGTLLILCHLAIILLHLINNPYDSWETRRILPSAFGLLLGITFVFRGLYALRKDRQLFVSFEAHQLRFRNAPQEEEQIIPYEQLRSVKPHTLGVYFFLRDGQKLYLNWEQADYDNIQQIKQKLQELQRYLESAEISA